MVSAGRVLIIPKGAYNPATTYEMLDLVSYNGSSYIAKTTTTGNLPTDTTYWQLSAYGGQAANIAGNFAEIETSSIATSVHYENDIFVDENSQLMKATQTINIGDTIDENTNCTPTTVEALISYLSSYVDSLDSLNKKIQGAIEIAAQTDLHSLAIGEYYKKQSTFYITNGPTEIDQNPTAIFRLTVEAALDNASQASSPLLLTLRTPDGKIYTQGFDGTIWGSWKQIADKSSLDAIEARVDAVEDSVVDIDTRVDSVESSVADVETSSTASKAYAIGESFYYNDVLYKATAAITQGGTITPGTNCTPEKIIEKIDDLVSENQTIANEVETRAKLGAHNLLDNSDPSVVSSGCTYSSGTFTNATQTDSRAANFAVALIKGTSTLVKSYDAINITANGLFEFPLYIPSGTDFDSITIGHNGQSANLKVGFKFNKTGNFVLAINVIGHDPSTANGYSFNNIMIKEASDPSTKYTPYTMTNRELTENVKRVDYKSKITWESDFTWAFGSIVEVNDIIYFSGLVHYTGPTKTGTSENPIKMATFDDDVLPGYVQSSQFSFTVKGTTDELVAEVALTSDNYYKMLGFVLKAV